jgi:hypothetical protein
LHFEAFSAVVTAQKMVKSIKIFIVFSMLFQCDLMVKTKLWAFYIRNYALLPQYGSQGGVFYL